MKLRNVAVAAAAISTLALTPVSGIAQPAPQAGIAQGAVQQPAAENTIPAGTVSEEILPAEFDDESWRQVIAEKGNRVQEVTVYSPSMDRKIPVVTIKADESAGPRPTLYLLNGAGGGEQSANWIVQTDAVDFYLEKNINVVIPMRGAFSYYTDWNETPTGSKYLQGPQKWETFLINELPGPIENYLGANGKRGIAGMSMSATSSLLLAAHNPGMFDATGSFSGCAETNSPMGRAAVGLTVNRGGAHPDQVWGPMGSQRALENDALLQAEFLRGTAIYVSNATGLIGERETAEGLRAQGIPEQALSANQANLAIAGGGIEAVTNACTHRFVAKLNHLGIPVHHHKPAVGTHTWSYWQDDLRTSWPTFANAFGIEQ
ncbi:alpha/beta hydrolase family protein [Corynebacterium pseudodiphtheriticum]|uniref:alpha/beta hydrolase n=1 Tax=Corynebacterium pseudodiphtheriticum TaxID=37637 RepID=UPI0020BE4E8D|nr:alpha/beta hydrolase family protein [Corynebacterium pseudodiphtheriticum]MDK8478639.1 alpha/beta hydrolase family protein [Corynebacterium pseudodiphtheriticum]MDK8545528.1 alpha/beta hydrolase family protein [Corynebacterium pseudodiphtheriticum]MDK8614584.1 alpha/beta hydrolase family protein [Corynebacterium pseudodiphtheriticum]MDK8738592.1 alpha/beta hydrolase family protein [Corynebacterium pseudodiphtheriticum]MDK8745134.1 alpha/beta hydrolase family protein [Corynebacterium pseudod